jgi:hypothetical protein
MAAGDTAVARITITNLGRSPWPDLRSASPAKADGSFAVRLSSRWLYGGRPVSDYALRADLPAPLDPFRTVTLRLPLRAPAAPGDYEVQFDLVEELVSWFGSRGAARLVVPVHVR